MIKDDLRILAKGILVVLSMAIAISIFSGAFIYILSAQANPPATTTTTAIRKSFDTEKLTIDSTSGGVGFTSSIINPTCTNCSPATSQANAAVCSLETGDIRVSTVTADVPTSSTGVYITAGQSFTLFGYNDISKFKGIRVTGTSGTLNCSFYR